MNNKVMIKIEKETLLIEKISVVEFEAPYGKGELRKVLRDLRRSVFESMENDYTSNDYNCVGIFINGVQAHIFDDEYLGFWGCGVIPAV